MNSIRLAAHQSVINSCVTVSEWPGASLNIVSDFLLIHVHTEMVSVPWAVIGNKNMERNGPEGTQCPSSLYSLPDFKLTLVHPGTVIWWVMKPILGLNKKDTITGKCAFPFWQACGQTGRRKEGRNRTSVLFCFEPKWVRVRGSLPYGQCLNKPPSLRIKILCG